ncbi:MAG: ACP S-malonyltransferase [Granulosicoccaceae bacterium]
MTFAAVFPGQGSQSVGMLADLANHWSEVKDTFTEASDVLGYDLWALSQDGPAEQQKQTQFTQPLMFAAGVACWRVWRSAGGELPAYAAGHSLGEYSAHVAAGVFNYADAVKLVDKRARWMSQAVPEGEGGMAAVLGMDDDALVELCRAQGHERVVEAVNFNAPGQVVISGHLDALEKACVAAKAAGARKAMMLPVSVPNHSSLMASVVSPLAVEIENTPKQMGNIQVVQNAEAGVLDGLESQMVSLKAHVANPVRWTASVQYLLRNGVDTQVEFGPGKVLTGLAKRVDRSLNLVCVEDQASLDKALEITHQQEAV